MYEYRVESSFYGFMGLAVDISGSLRWKLKACMFIAQIWCGFGPFCSHQRSLVSSRTSVYENEVKIIYALDNYTHFRVISSSSAWYGLGVVTCVAE